jgi:DNA replicative helicase MCM subunit Mcm2 (Cdc46/Mcm family)
MFFQFIFDKLNNLKEKLIRNKLNQTSSFANETSNSNSNSLDNDDYLPVNLSTKSIQTIKVRILNYRPLTKIKQIKANMYDKFVSILGTVTRTSNSKPFVKRLAFECNKCNSTFVN